MIHLNQNWHKHVIQILGLCLISGMGILLYAGSYPELPAADILQDNMVSLPVLERIADTQARYIWPEAIARSRAIPLSDATGKTAAYAFVYSRNSETPPDFKNLFYQISNLRSRYRAQMEADGPGWTARLPRAYFNGLNKIGRQFGTVIVSATEKHVPVQRMMHFLPNYIVLGEAAQEIAETHFGRDDVRLKRIYYAGPEKEAFEFISGERAVLVDANTLEIKNRDEVMEKLSQLPPVDSDRDYLQKAWETVRNITPKSMAEDEINKTFTIKEITKKEMIPVVNHTSKHWCVPASKAMILGFWDNYTHSTGTIIGYGRLIDFWYEFNPGGHNMPNLADESLPGFQLWQNNNYTSKWTDTKADKNNNYAWKELKAEIDAGRPAFWSYSGHTMAAFGYVINGGAKFVRVYDPPNPSTPTYVSDEAYEQCIGITSVIPQEGTAGENLIIWDPDGGETFNTADPAVITWFVWGKTIKQSTLSFSVDGGTAWIPIANNISTKGAWNMFVWFPNIISPKVRVQVKGYTDKNELIASDGSQNNLAIQGKKSSGYHQLLHKYSGKYICTGHTNNGGRVHLWGPIPAGHEARYMFKFIHTGDGYYYIQHKYSGKYICSGDKHNGGVIHLWGPVPKGHEDRYKFKLIPTLDGYYNILHKHSGKYVCSGDKTNDGAVHLWGPIPSGHEDRYKFKIKTVQ